MKTILTKFLTLGGITLLMLSACKKDGTLVTSNGGKPGALTASTTTPVLDKNKLTDTTSIVRFNFTPPNYGYSAAVTNTLQIDAAGDNWVHPMSVNLSNKVFAQGYSTAAFNALLLKLNLPAGVAAQVNVRIVHSISSSVPPVYSNVLSLTATPFNLTSYLWITGSFAGWQNPGPQEDSLVSVTGNGIYVGIINFTTGNRDFLILPKKGDWSHKYATTDPVNSTSATVTYDASNNLFAPPAAGYYEVVFNANTGTVSFTPVNYYSVLGSAPPGGDWATDTNLKYLNDGTSTWAGVVPMTAVQFKIRQNHDWTFSWGNASPADGTSATDSNGGNIDVAAAGNYKVTFTIPITAVGTPPPVTATYTLTKVN